MKISELLNSEIEETFDFRGHKAFIVVMPDLYMLEDSANLNKSDMQSVAEYVAKGLKEVGVIVNGERILLTDDKKKKLELTPDSIRLNIPESFLMQVITKIEFLKMSTAGKPTVPSK